MKNEYGLVKVACYTANAAMSVVSALSPLLFLTFRTLYNISFSLLGSLVLINFFTQLIVDLIFSFYSHKFDISKMVKLTPVLTSLGLLIYACTPFIFPNAVYAGLVVGTIIFAASGGLAEVLISPVIAALPSDNPEREMSKLHSVFAWGVVVVVIVSTIFLRIFGNNNWQWLAILWILVPLLSCFLFFKSKVPYLATPKKSSNVLALIRKKEFIIYFVCILLGGATECSMSQWCSSYLEKALNIPKVWGDIFGVAMFAVMLGLGRTLYSTFGKNIHRVLLIGSLCAVFCYIVAGVSNIALLGLIACAMTGLCASMLWPGSLIIASDKFPDEGVAVFALMAAGGDLGVAIGPQVIGIIADKVIASEKMLSFATSINLTIEQFAMKVGLLSATAFPLIATILYISLYRKRAK